MLIKNQTSESGHWYERDGKPAYTVTAKNGQNRATTLRDARTLSLVPSVTTILNIAAKPGLDTWKQQQVLLAALTLPRQENESEQQWLERVMQDSKTTGKIAAERGTSLHAIVEGYFADNSSVPSEYVDMCRTVQATLDAHFGPQNWKSEKSFAHEIGYGGKVDLHSDNIVVDIKTKEGSLDKVDVYAEHGMQLAAYREGFKMPMAYCANLFIGYKVVDGKVVFDGQVKLIEHSQSDLNRYWNMFKCLLAFWQLKNNYK